MELVEVMWEQFQNLRAYESNVIDTTDCSLEETVSMVMKKVADGTALLWRVFFMGWSLIFGDREWRKHGVFEGGFSGG